MVPIEEYAERSGVSAEQCVVANRIAREKLSYI